MTAEREAFLGRVRQAVVAGNRAGVGGQPPPRGGIGYQGGGTDPAARFAAELAAAGGRCHRVADDAAALATLLALARECSARRVLLGGGPVLERLGVEAALRGAGLEPLPAGSLPEEGRRDAFFAADLGVTGVDFLIAETGTTVLATHPDLPRAASLLPPVHVAVAERGQLLPDLFDLFEPGRWPDGPPACLSLITGPSKTGDIELRLVTGVHGPGELHVVLIGG
jgi:L-lactate utilization protein LutC